MSVTNGIQPQEYLDDYLSYIEDQSPSTVKQKRITAERFCEYCDDHGITLQVHDEDAMYDTVDLIREFFDLGYIKLSGTRLSLLRDFIKFIGRHQDTRTQDKLHDVANNKLTMERLPEPETESQNPEWLADEEIEATIDEADAFGELVINLLFDTGCRRAELVAVTPQDIDFDPDKPVGATIRITKAYDGDGGLKPPKTDTGNRTVELTPDTADQLEAWIADNQVGESDHILGEMSSAYKKVYRTVKSAFTDAEIKLKENGGKSRVSPHWLRHNRNTRLRKQYGQAQVEQYMGHKDESMSKHYTEYDSEEVQGLLVEK